MKQKLAKILIPVLCAVMLFAGCASQKTTTGAVTNTSAETAADSTQSSVSSTNTESAEKTGDFADAFSERDLSGAYDDEAVSIQLSGTSAKASSDSVRISGAEITITGAGTYILTGSLSSGTIIVDAAKEDKVQLVLNGVSIHSETYAAIYVKQADKVFVTLADGTQNTLSNGGTFKQTDDNNVDAVIFSKDDLTLNGTGALQIKSPGGHGIVGKDEVTITKGAYVITASEHAIRANDLLAIADGTFTITAGEDGLHAENSDDDTLGSLYIAGGTFNITASDDAVHATALLQIDAGTLNITAAEGLESTYIRINGGTIGITASDDGVNAAHKSSAYTPTIEINDGKLTIEMGAGDTDGLDSNGNIVVNGGTIDVTGSSAFDYDGSAQYNGGTIIVNGQQVDSISTQMMGGPGGGFGGGFGGGRGPRG